MAGKKEKGYRYPTGKLNQLARAYVGGQLTGGLNPEANSIQSSEGLASGGIIEGADTGTGEGEGITRPALTNSNRGAVGLPPDPKFQKPSHWANFVKGISKGLIDIDQSGIKNQLELQKYNFQLQQLINNGQFEQAKILAEAKGAADLAKAQQEQKDKVEFDNVQTDNEIKKTKISELAKQGIIMPDDNAAMAAYNRPGYGMDNAMGKLRVGALETGVKSNLLSSPEGGAEYRQSLIDEYRKQGALNKASNASAAVNEVEARVKPYMNLNNRSLVNVLQPELSYSDMGSTRTPIMAQVGDAMLPTGEYKVTAPQVVGVNALEGTKLRVKPKTNNVDTNTQVSPEGFLSTDSPPALRPPITGTNTNAVMPNPAAIQGPPKPTSMMTQREAIAYDLQQAMERIKRYLNGDKTATTGLSGLIQ